MKDSRIKILTGRLDGKLLLYLYIDEHYSGSLTAPEAIELIRKIEERL